MPTPIAAALATIAFKLFLNLRFPQNQTLKLRARANLRRQFLQLPPRQIQLYQFFRMTLAPCWDIIHITKSSMSAILCNVY